jgi:hypothetical protein
MKQSWHGYVIIGAVVLGSALSAATAQQQNPPKQQNAQPAQQPRPTFVPARQSAAGQLNTAAQGPAKAVGTFEGSRGTPSTPVPVQPSTTTVNAATIAAQQNAAERARQAATSRKVNLDNRPVPPPGSR